MSAGRKYDNKYLLPHPMAKAELISLEVQTDILLHFTSLKLFNSSISELSTGMVEEIIMTDLE